MTDKNNDANLDDKLTDQYLIVVEKDIQSIMAAKKYFKEGGINVIYYPDNQSALKFLEKNQNCTGVFLAVEDQEINKQAIRAAEKMEVPYLFLKEREEEVICYLHIDNYLHTNIEPRTLAYSNERRLETDDPKMTIRYSKKEAVTWCVMHYLLMILKEKLEVGKNERPDHK